jgi:hypothetical protein
MCECALRGMLSPRARAGQGTGQEEVPPFDAELPIRQGRVPDRSHVDLGLHRAKPPVRFAEHRMHEDDGHVVLYFQSTSFQNGGAAVALGEGSCA